MGPGRDTQERSFVIGLPKMAKPTRVNIFGVSPLDISQSIRQVPSNRLQWEAGSSKIWTRSRIIVGYVTMLKRSFTNCSSIYKINNANKNKRWERRVLSYCLIDFSSLIKYTFCIKRRLNKQQTEFVLSWYASRIHQILANKNWFSY